MSSQLMNPKLNELLLNQYFHSTLNGKYLIALIIGDESAITQKKNDLQKKYHNIQLEVLIDLVNTTNNMKSFFKVNYPHKIEKIYFFDVLTDLKEFELYLTEMIVQGSKIKL